MIDESEKHVKDSIFLNAYLPHLIVSLSKRFNTRIIHISTDCVFSGEFFKSPYTEIDIGDGKSIYSRTKFLGEVTVSPHLTIRTSVIGPEIDPKGTQLFSWFISNKNNKSITGFSEKIWSGVTSLELARAVSFFISSNDTGIFHLTNNKPVSKYEILCFFKEFLNANVFIEKSLENPNNKSFVDTRKLLPYKVPSYKEMIKDMIDFVRLNPDLYSHYEIY